MIYDKYHILVYNKAFRGIKYFYAKNAKINS